MVTPTDPGATPVPASSEDAQALLAVGLAMGAARQGERAVPTLERAVTLDPDLAEGWRALHGHLTTMGELDRARRAQARCLRALATEPALRQAAEALCDERFPEAEFLLKNHLRKHPDQPLALRLLAEAAFCRQRDEDAIRHLTRCLELDPDMPGLRFARALACYRAGHAVPAQTDLEAELARHPDDAACRALLAAVLSKTSEIERTVKLYEDLAPEYPSQPKLWTSYGHVLKASGRQLDSIAAYRRAIELDAGLGEAWWSLANLKTVKFGAADIDAMKSQLARADLDPDDRLHFEFALGKALEDARRYEESFVHYDRGNRLRLETAHYDPESSTVNLRRSQRLLTGEFFAARAGLGCPAPDPIFIVGLPRAGSTLLEQILASHPMVEGTMELPDITNIARGIADRRRDDADYDYLPLLAEVRPEEWRALGESYLETTRVHRKLGRPFFIDKMPNNFTHLGLIHLILPNARIIDARRHPLASCFSNFKQHFALGQLFSYGLDNIGRFYRDYVELMAHYDAVLPGRVHRVFYERMVEDTENEVRRLLDYCGLPFDEACLRFYENDRIVRTASSEQVRRPIYREGVDHWRHYEPWLGPLKAALGPVLTVYPEVPPFPPS
jgi:tetratricopeptide (TPR) repeat protein